MCLVFIMSVLASMSSLVLSTESIHSFTKLLADVPIETIGKHLNVKTLVQCGVLCANRIGDELPCEGYSFRSGNGTCQLYTGNIQHATGPGEWVYKRNQTNASKYEGNLTIFVPSIYLPHDDAREYCLSQGADLLHIDSLLDYTILREQLPAYPGNILHIGIKARETPGAWTYDRDGQAVNTSLLLWYNGEPAHPENGRCLVILPTTATIVDYHCDFSAYFICENRHS